MIVNLTITGDPILEARALFKGGRAGFHKLGLRDPDLQQGGPHRRPSALTYADGGRVRGFHKGDSNTSVGVKFGRKNVGC